MAAELPEYCEITGCQTRLIAIPGKPSYRKRGKADVFVNDRFGAKRGICCQHFHELSNDAGLLPNQELIGRDGAYDRAKVLQHWATMDQAKPSMPLLPPAPPIAKGLADVLGELDLPHNDTPPNWDDRPW